MKISKHSIGLLHIKVQTFRDVVVLALCYLSKYV